jgi:Tfp pilus assembly protein PilX
MSTMQGDLMTCESRNERGSALVFAIGVMAVLAVLALVITSVVINEKRTSSAEYAYNRAFYSADAASEAGVHWIRGQLSPPATVDTVNNVRVSTGPATLSANHSYEFGVQYVTKQFRPGWSVEYKDYVYRVEATGSSSQSSQAAMQVNATRLYREGY